MESRAEQDREIALAFEQQYDRLRNFIRAHSLDANDVEDILQDVFYEFVSAYRMMKPITLAGAWLFRVARNRITDRARKKRPEALPAPDASEGTLGVEDLLLSPDAGPEQAYARSVLLAELEDAIESLPEDQRRVFVAHAIDGVSFKDMAEETGVPVNTLLARKHYAVLRLRDRLQSIYDELRRGGDL